MDCLAFIKSGFAVSATCSFQCWVLESWHGNSSSFTLHKLHFQCDSRARPARQPIASLTINLISENAVHLFGCEEIEILMKRVLSKSPWIMPQYICVFMVVLPAVMCLPEGPGDDNLVWRSTFLMTQLMRCLFIAVRWQWW